MLEVLLEIAKYLIPALVVFAVTFIMLRQYLQKEYRIKQLEYKMAIMRDTQPVRMQAFERLSLFLERLAFSNLLQRVRKSSMNVREFQLALLSTIRQEYDHNITQQIYVSTELWNMIRASREEVTSIINQTAAQLPPEAPSAELSKRIFSFLIESDTESGTQRALDKLKAEVHGMY